MFSKLATKITRFTGTPTAFTLALTLVIGWLISGPYFHWSEMHSMFINTITTVITFLQAFLIQYGQNKNDVATHIKLDAIIKSLEQIDDKYKHIEELDEAELKELREEL